MLSHKELLLRIAVGAVLGGIIGYERDRHGRPVGLRTHFIVAMAAATFMVISSQFVYFQHYGPDDLVEVDASRIAASVVAAVGFLGAGAILRNGGSVQGVTTAAGLWLVTAIGMCAGAGMYVEGGAVTVLGLVALTVLRRLVDQDDNVVRRRVSVLMQHGSDALPRITSELRALCLEVADVEYDSRLAEDKKSTLVTFDIRIAGNSLIPQMVQRLQGVPGLERVRVRMPE